MKFSHDPRFRRTAEFEPVPDIDLHEQFVATSALGLLTTQNRHNKPERTSSSFLAMKIAHLEATQPDENGKPQPRSTFMPLFRREAVLLRQGLLLLIEDVPVAIVQALPQSLHLANIRAAESATAEKMVEVLSKEFSLKPPQPKLGFGFNR